MPEVREQQLTGEQQLTHAEPSAKGSAIWQIALKGFRAI